MKFEDLWIGDKVGLKSANKNVVWEGFSGHEMAKVRDGSSVKEVPLVEIVFPFDEEKEEIEFPELDVPSPQKFDGEEIDLHIETLNPSLNHQAPELILNHQLKACENFVHNAIRNKKPSILIVHGKGTGVLRSEVQHLLKSFPEIHFTFDRNNKGATEVWLKYF